MIITRFAPSPTGYLHMGHAWSALFAEASAKRERGKFLLRIEDIDPIRCKPEFTTAIFEDLMWLGLSWEEPVRCQSQHMDDYGTAFDVLWQMGVVYPCFCTRNDILKEVAESGQAPHWANAGHIGPIYPGTCKNIPVEEAEARAQKENPNWRLDVEIATEMTGPLFWHDRAKGKIEARPQDFGDVVLARKDVMTTYHLSVTVDDHLQGINLVTRGNALFGATHIHRLLQALLGYTTPDYHHYALLTDASGKRFAKRDQSITLRALRESGKTADDIRMMIKAETL